MNFSTKLKPSSSLIDLTPIVDVIFLLLIFFIITSDILPLKSLNVENPRLNKDSVPLTTQLLVGLFLYRPGQDQIDFLQVVLGRDYL